MASNGPPDDYYKPYTGATAAASQAGNQSSSAAANESPQQASAQKYQAYRPGASQAQAPPQQPPYPAETGHPAGGYKPYNPQGGAPQAQNQFVHELPADHQQQQQQQQPSIPPLQTQQVPPIINIQEPTPAPSLASESRPTTIVSPTDSVGLPSHIGHSIDDELYDEPSQLPSYGRSEIGSAAATSDVKPSVQGTHFEPPQYHQPEGPSVSYNAPHEGKSGGSQDTPSDKLTHEIGNMLLSEGSTSNAGSTSVAQNLPPQYHEPEGTSLEHTPAQKGKASTGLGGGADEPPQYHQPEGTSLEHQPVHEGKAALTEDLPPQYHEPEGTSLQHQPVNDGKAATAHATTSEDLPPQYHQPEGSSLEHQPTQHGKAPLGAAAAGIASASAIGAESTQQHPPPPADTHVPYSPSQASEYEAPPPLPPRRPQQPQQSQPQQQQLQPQEFGEDDPSNPIHYARDPHKLIAYLIPFPVPHHHSRPVAEIPDRFLIYTPPPPPLSKPAEGEKETRMHKVQRKWQEEVRSAKTSTAKTASWQGVKSKATKGIDWAMSQTVSSNLDFLNRLGEGPRRSRTPSPNRPASPGKGTGAASPPGAAGGANTESALTTTNPDSTEAKVGLEEMVLVYPSSIKGTQEEIRAEFVNSMLRSKSKAQRDAVIATGLLPVAFAADVLATVIWPFGGLLEIDSVWAYSSIRGAKIARSTTNRLSGPTTNTCSITGLGKTNKPVENALKLSFTPSARLEVLQRYLAEKCHERDGKKFPSAGVPPTETEVLEAIGWAPRQCEGETRNWEDEQWEMTDVKEDFRTVMKKGAREWEGWCKEFEKDPKKAMKK